MNLRPNSFILLAVAMIALLAGLLFFTRRSLWPIDQSDAIHQKAENSQQMLTIISGLEAGSPETVNPSPYEMRRYINEHRSDEHTSLAHFWQRFGVELEPWKQYGHCEVSLFPVSLDNQPGKEILMRLRDNSGWSLGATRYVIFKASGSGQFAKWNVIGNVDFEDQWHAVYPHRIVASKNRRWLLLTATTGHGSGFWRTEDRWYEIRRGKLKEVLCYLSRAYSMGSPEISSNAKLIKVTTESDMTIVRVRFSVTETYYDYGGRPRRKSKTLYKRHTVRFSRRAGSQKFFFDRKGSPLSEKRLYAIYDVPP